MEPAEFEEREYEAPLYNQLERGNRRVWAPGQVFEGHVGLDYALFAVQEWIFRLHGRGSYLPGAILQQYVWPQHWFVRRQGRQLPNFRLNLFIQAKRPWWGLRAPKGFRQFGFKGPYWKFRIRESQQKSLDAVARKLNKRALVVYAAPAFHEYRDLWRYTQNGRLPRKSTFPSVRNLTGHLAWYYNAPGAKGVANPEPKSIVEPSLDQRLRAVLEEVPIAGFSSEGWSSNLSELAGGIKEALLGSDVGASPRLARFFDSIRVLERDLGGISELTAVMSYLTVITFVVVFAVDWYVLG